MKIAYLINGLDGGGAALPVPDVCKTMQGCGHDVHIIAFMPKDGRAIPKLEAANLPFTIIGDGRSDYIKPAARLLKILREAKPDLLWTSLTRATLYGQIAGALLRIPVVSWQHNAFLKPANRALLSATKNLSLHWVADSENVVQFATAALGLKRNDLDIWPLFMANPKQPIAQAWHPPGPFRIGSLGRLHRNKGYDVLIEAMARLRARTPALADKIRVEIAGVGPEHDALAAQAARANNDVHFIGFCDDPYTFLAGLHAYMQPSRNEGLCIAAHEAMHAGLPVIASPVGEISNSIVDGETGLLAPIGDAAKLAEHIAQLASNPARAAQMGSAAHTRIAERFSVQRFENSGRDILKTIERKMAARKR